MRETRLSVRGSPQRIGKAHLADQLADLKRHRRSSPVRPRLPTPIGSEPNTVPANDRLRPDHSQGMASIRKQSMETDEYQPVEGVEAQSLRRGAPQDDELRNRACLSSVNYCLSNTYDLPHRKQRNRGNVWGNVMKVSSPESRLPSKAPVVLPSFNQFALSRRKQGFESPRKRQ